MSFQLFVEMPGGDKVVDTTKKIEDGLDRSAAAAGRARDAAGRFTKSAIEAGDAAAKGGERAAAGHGKARAAAEGHGDALTNVIHAVEAYLAIHQFEAIVDGYVEVRNKINAVSESQDNLNGLMGETYRIAQETRSAWDTLAATYQRLANAGRGLGISQRQILDLTEELSMGLRLSGSSSREASMTMMELTHAFTVGTLTGREFRVMMKDAPALMHELQVVSGRTGAEFAEMGKHGKFTAQALIEWFGKARDTIRDKFGQTIPTIAEDLLIVKNAAEKFFGEAAVGSGVMTALANAARHVAEHFDGIARVALAVGEALLGLFVIEKIIALVRALTVAVAANPLGAILTAITVGISLLRQFGDQIDTNVLVWTNVKGVFVTVKDDLDALWVQLKKLGAEILDFLGEAWTALTRSFSEGLDGSGMELSLHNVIRLVSGFVGALRGLFHVMAEDSDKTFALMAYTMTEAMVKAANAIIHAIEAVASAPRRALFDAMNHTVEKQAEALDAAKKNFDSYLAKNGPHLAATVRYELEQKARAAGPDPLNAPGDPSHRVVTDQEVGTELARRGKIIFDAEIVHEYARRGLDQRGEDPRNGRYRLYGEIENPLEGTPTEALARSAIEDIKTAAKAAMDDFDRTAHDIAAARVQRPQGPGTVSEVKGMADEKPVDDKAVKAYEKLRNELRAILEATNPVTAAEEKLAHAQEILTKAVAAHDPVTGKQLLTQEAATRALEDYQRKEQDALDPMGAFIRKQLEAEDALRDTAREQERAIAVQSTLNELRQKGIVVTESERAKVAELVERLHQRTELMRTEQQIFEQIHGPAHQYQLALAAAGDLLERGRINAEQYGQAVDKIRAAYLAAKPDQKSFADGLEAAWLQAKQDAQDFGASVAKLATDDLGKLNDAIVTAANNGQVSWGQMVDSMIRDLERLILKQLEVAAINAIIGAAGGGVGEAAVGSGAGGVAAGPITSPSQVQRVSPAAVAPTPPAFMSPPAALSGVPASAAPAARVVLHVHNHYDTDIGVAAIATPNGQTAVVNVMRSNRAAVRAALGIKG